MISKALRFYFPTLIRANIFPFTQINSRSDNFETVFLERRIQQSKYPSDLLLKLSNEESLTPQLVHQYCYKISTMYARQKAKGNIFRFLDVIRKIDRSSMTLEELSNLAAVCSSSIQINMQDYKLFSEIMGDIKKHIKNKQQALDIPNYALINLYQFFSKSEVAPSTTGIMNSLLKSFDQQSLSINDFCALTKIISEKSSLSRKEKILFAKILQKVQELMNTDRLYLGPKIRLCSNIRKASFCEIPASPHSKLFRQVVEMLQQDIKKRIEEMNETHILLILKQMPPSHFLYRMICNQILDHINEQGQSQIPPQLLSKLLKVFSIKGNIRKIKKQSFNKIFKMYSKNLADIHHNYQRDILEQISNKFYSRNQMFEIQKLFESQDIYQDNLEYIYECLSSNIIFNDYSKFEASIEKTVLPLQDKNFLISAIVFSRLASEKPENQTFKEMNEKYMKEIEENLPKAFNIIRRWKGLRSEILENFVEEFGDKFVNNLLANAAKEKRSADDLILFLYLGNGIRHINQDNVTIQTSKHIVTHALNDIQKARNRIQFINKMILSSLRNFESMNDKQEKTKEAGHEEQENEESNKKNNAGYRIIQKTLYIKKIFAYISHKEVNSILKINDFENFLKIPYILIEKFPDYFKDHRNIEMLIGMLVHLQDTAKESKAYEDLLTIIQKQPAILEQQHTLNSFIFYIKRACVMTPEFAQKALEKLNMQENANEKIGYLNAISGKITELANVPLNIGNLNIIAYLGSHYVQINQSFLQENFELISSQIEEIKNPQMVIEAIGHINIQKRVSSGSAIHKIHLKLIDRLARIIQSLEEKYVKVFSIHPLRIVVESLRVMPWAKVKEIDNFLSVLANYATSSVANISLENHYQILQAFAENKFDDQKYFKALIETLENDNNRSAAVAVPKLRVLNQLSAMYQIPLKQLYLHKYPQGVIKGSGMKLMFSILKNIILKNSSDEAIKLMKKFIESMNKTFGIREADAKFLSVKSNGSLDHLIENCRRLENTSRPQKQLVVRDFIMKQAEAKGLNPKILEESERQIIEINDHFFYIESTQNNYLYEAQAEFILTIFKDKREINKQKLMVLFIKNSKPKSIVEALYRFYPQLINDVQKARKELKEMEIQEIINNKERKNKEKKNKENKNDEDSKSEESEQTKI